MANPLWIMSSAWPEKNLDQLMETARRLGFQGLELCVFRRDGARQDHVATHLDYEDFGPRQAQGLLDRFNDGELRFSIGAFENLIGGEEEEKRRNQDHLLRLIRMAALLGGNDNDVKVGTFVGYDHRWDGEEGAFKRNLEAYRDTFAPIIRYAEDLNVTVLYENCPMEGWRSAGYSRSLNNLPCTLAARKLMYALIPSKAHGEIYDPSHDVWQFVDPVEVLKAGDMSRIHRVHLKGTRMKNDRAAVHWGQVFGKQRVPEEWAEAAGVPLPAHEWDRFAYEPMVPGFGGSDSMDWRAFAEALREEGFTGPLSIENEGANSKGTGRDGAIEQGFAACRQFMMPLVWPLTEEGYAFPGQAPLGPARTKDLPLYKRKDFD